MKRVVRSENGAEPREHEFSSVGSGRAGWCRMTGRKAFAKIELEINHWAGTGLGLWVKGRTRWRCIGQRDEGKQQQRSALCLRGGLRLSEGPEWQLGPQRSTDLNREDCIARANVF